MSPTLPMFPLGAVLLPGSALPLQVFEPRYLTMMEHLAGSEAPSDGERLPPVEFGIVLIRRGSEVGGGDARGEVGTVARVDESRRLEDGRWLVVVTGTRRIRVQTWLEDDPYPQAEVAVLDEPAWDDGEDDLMVATTRKVRRALSLAAELGVGGGPVRFELDPDPVTAVWQLAALAPIGPLDRQRILEGEDLGGRLRTVGDATDDVSAVLEYRLGSGQ